MQVGRVIGNATSTVKHASLQSERMLIVQLLTRAGTPDGEPVIAFDRMGARRGDQVVLTNDGRAMQELMGPRTPARWSVLALPDQ